ncbi:MAG: hypothetical protein EOP11_17215 [Proteobacteria bacterium]|nr:MAG: hypothetical protein EOP11_17215 [Pseudomonadota bacterium]
MEAFAVELKNTRLKLGHRTARAFHAWLKERGASFNYSYYMRLEQGGLPSEKVVQEIANACRAPAADRLLLSYCRSLFPKSAYLFPEPAEEKKPAPIEDDPSLKGATIASQKELSLRQVAAIGAGEVHYHIFLLCTLARKAIRPEELGTAYPAKVLNAAFALLVKHEVLRQGEEGFEARAPEARFPDAFNQELKDAYARFDQWDESFGSRFALDQLLNKLLLRRVSGRYLSIINKQLDALFEIVKSSDEVDQRHNDKVLQLKVVLRQGKLPG